MSRNKGKLLEQAGFLALEYRHKGFHCSESVFSAVNDTLKITEPEMVRTVTGFHGGGGARRKDPKADLTACLEEVASGRERRPPEEWPVQVTGHLCGALAAGIVCIGFLFGRRQPHEDLTYPDELSYELHRRFERKFGTKICREIRQVTIPRSENHTCEMVYQESARMIVELILDSGVTVDRCRGPARQTNGS